MKDFYHLEKADMYHIKLFCICHLLYEKFYSNKSFKCLLSVQKCYTPECEIINDMGYGNHLEQIMAMIAPFSRTNPIYDRACKNRAYGTALRQRRTREPIIRECRASSIE